MSGRRQRDRLTLDAPRAAATTQGSHMKVNEGVIDRSLRVIAGLVLIGLAATGTVGTWAYIGIVPLLTGAIGMCPLYSLLGINTCPTPKR
jgi:hypothetical protein